MLGAFSSKGENFWGVISDDLWDVGRGVLILIKKTNLHNSFENHETNLLSIINQSLAYVYCSMTIVK
jgi:hypothetical protein